MKNAKPSKTARGLLGPLILLSALACGEPELEPGVAGPPPELDTDADGLADVIELGGWTIRIDVTGGGDFVEREVTSDPTVADTDGDGLGDFREYSIRSDPRETDTDLDDLDDFAEFNIYKSIPTSVDSDGDARGPDGSASPNPSLFDGVELELSGTSPTLADTDGDGLTDYEEIVGGGSNPLVADLPAMTIEIRGDPSVTLNVVYEDEETTYVEQAALARNEQATTKSNRNTSSATIENTERISAEAEVSGLPPSPRIAVTAEQARSESYFSEAETSFTRSSVSATQEQLRRARGSRKVRTYKDGEIAIALEIVSRENRSFSLDNFTIVAYRQVGGRLTTLATLAPAEASDAPFTFSKNQPLRFTAENRSVNADKLRELLDNPTGLVFEVGRYQLSELPRGDEPGRDFAAIGEHVVERTGTILIDFGNGRIERHRVATNVERNLDGSAAGVRLGDALERILGIDFETEMNETLQRRVLVEIDGVRTEVDPSDPAGRAFWYLAGDTAELANGTERVHFEDHVIRNSETVSLVFVRDSDGDGVFDREERLMGTDIDRVDTDGDGLDDWQELRESWTLFGEVVYPDARFQDFDGDGLDDAQERALGTHPRRADSDGDGWADDIDEAPLDDILLAHFPLDRVDDDGTVLDVSVHGRIGVVQEGVLTAVSDRDRIRARALDFAEGGVVTPSILPSAGGFTISAWIRKAHANSELTERIAGEVDRGALYFRDGHLAWQVGTDAGTVYLQEAAFHGSTEWAYVVGVAEVVDEGTRLTLYVVEFELDANGSERPVVARHEETFPNTLAQDGVCRFGIGAGGCNTAHGGLEASVDTVRVYGRALGESEVLSAFYIRDPR